MALGLTYVPGAALGQQKSLKDQLVGTWTLVSAENTAPDGSKRQLFGANPKGILTLDSGGRFTQITFAADRPKFKVSDRLQGTPEEYAAAVRGTAANYGAWSVDEASKTITLRIEGSLLPNQDGTRESARSSI